MCNDHLNVAFIYQDRCVHVSLIENWLWPKTKLRSTMHFTWTLKYIWEKATTTATDRKKSRARLAKQQLCTCIRLFCTFLCRFCMTWTWNFLLFLYLDQSLRIDSTENFANVRKIEWNAARVMKLETARIRFSTTFSLPLCVRGCLSSILKISSKLEHCYVRACIMWSEIMARSDALFFHNSLQKGKKTYWPHFFKATFILCGLSWHFSR